MECIAITRDGWKMRRKTKRKKEPSNFKFNSALPRMRLVLWGATLWYACLAVFHSCLRSTIFLVQVKSLSDLRFLSPSYSPFDSTQGILTLPCKRYIRTAPKRTQCIIYSLSFSPLSFARLGYNTSRPCGKLMRTITLYNDHEMMSSNSSKS